MIIINLLFRIMLMYYFSEYFDMYFLVFVSNLIYFNLFYIF